MVDLLALSRNMSAIGSKKREEDAFQLCLLFDVKGFNLHLAAQHSIKDCYKANLEHNIFTFSCQSLKFRRERSNTFQLLKGLTLFLHLNGLKDSADRLIFV